MRKDITVVLGFMLIALMLMSCSSSSEKNGDGGSQSAVKSNLASLTAMDLDGNTRSFSEFVGKKALIVNFWGVWCPPCKREMPDLKKIYDEYKDRDLEIIGLAVVKSSPQRVKDYVEQNGYDWPMLVADANNARGLGLGSGVPYTLFIDKNGNMHSETFTGMRGYKDFKRMVEQII